MNRVASGEDRYYIASVKKDGGRFFVRFLSVSKDGRVLVSPPVVECLDSRDANKRCRDAVKTKVKCRGYTEVLLDSLPEPVLAFLLVDVDKQMTPEELSTYVRKIRSERYVVFSDVVGMEDFFDAGIQYVGYDYGDDTLEVHDKFGQIRDVYRNRLLSVEKTENSMSSWALMEKAKNE